MKRLVIALALLAPARARADEATAQLAYDQAEALRRQNHWADACPLYEASYKADPQLGVLLHLADCHEHVGMVASAWLEFTDAIDLARQKHDSREASAKKHADALAPKVSRLHLAPPPRLYPGLAVTRDGKDITVLVGSDMPIDPGDHRIVASAPGYLDWTTKISIAAPGTTTPLAIPELQKVPEKPVVVEPPKFHDGTLVITTQPGAEITLDGEPVGTGRYEGKVKSKGHTLRVTAKGMRPYQSEIVITDDETRTIDVPLEKEPERVVVVAPPPATPAEDLPGAEIGANLLSGVKLRRDNPLVAGVRADIAFRFGRRTNFGVFAEAGEIDPRGTCGFDMPGPTPMSPYDVGIRTRMTSCTYVMPGLQLYIHALPKRRLDPYFGVAPGFRFGFVRWTPYFAGTPQPPRSEMFPAIVTALHAGIDYHPRPDHMAWQVGAYIDGAITVAGEESSHDYDPDNKPHASLWLLAGLRTSVTF